ncbi:transmembrane amino acid transporter protein-domain-containing protein [Dactylonectria estremocensis]|uniref:Transmembrane amino acid transporter protein-domain-containing protein n=1 Tax=Dactylonectria estremocensis TaxID=1079267 RepID=A0A9P9D225_9HYPO|nr:transmembrane amino acid transporter protein-domain-containing protein [Dactylonectria estremocensis]
MDRNQITLYHPEDKSGDKYHIEPSQVVDLEKEKTAQGDAYFHRLGWKRLMVVLMVTSIALGSLSLPGAFATLGMVAGVIVTIGFGFIAIYASYIIGLVKLKYPEIHHYADVGRLLLGSFGDKLFSVIFVGLLVLVVGSHCLTGTIALVTLTESNVCSLVFGVVSAIILLILAIPPSFCEVAILGYIDFASIILAIGITVVATGIKSLSKEITNPWSAWPKDELTLAEAFVAISGIVFAYAFAAAQMHTPADFTKSITVFGIIQCTIYTLTGALIYAFVGQDVQSPALLSAGPVVAKIAFGIALPVIYISGSINTTVACRFIHGRMYRDSITRYINAPKGWATWILVVSVVTFFSWIIAEAIPFFSELLSLTGCLFVAGLSFYIPPTMWFCLLKEGKWYERHNLRAAIANLMVFVVGFTVFGIGTYASVVEIVSFYSSLFLSLVIIIKKLLQHFAF